MESIEFDIPELLHETTQLLIYYFEYCAEAAPDFVCYLPNERFVEILQNDDLHISEEYKLVQWIKYYFKHHTEHRSKDTTYDAREMAGEEVWSRLTDAEREARVKAAKKLQTDAEDAIKKLVVEDTNTFHKIQDTMDDELW